MATSNKKFWWFCAKGHSWEASCSNRVAGTGCPVCYGRVPALGVNDLATSHPLLASEWHVYKNGQLQPTSVLAGTNKRIWWQCEKGHEWQASGASRVAGKGCPVCKRRVIVSGYNDLFTTHPLVASQWLYAKNGAIQPKDVFAGSNQKVWWACNKGHEWQASCASRTTKNTDCPVCSGNVAQAGVNDLLTMRPELAAQWDAFRNKSLRPSDVTPGSGKSVWWLCELGHSWKTLVSSRNNGTGCPICSGKSVLAGFNDLATTDPQLASEWDLKSNPVGPDCFTSGSGKSVWWLCSLNHSWKATIGSRKAGNGCPVCSGQALLTGFNDLATIRPELVAEWDFERNHPVVPSEIISGTMRKFWWMCSEGHSWQASGATRMRSNCPSCAAYGFRPGKPALLYFLKHQELFSRKVGIINVGSDRITRFQKNGWTVLYTFQSNNGHLVQALEKDFFVWLRKTLGLTHHLGPREMGREGGWTETFSQDAPTDHEVIAFITTLVEQSTPK